MLDMSSRILRPFKYETTNCECIQINKVSSSSSDKQI